METGNGVYKIFGAVVLVSMVGALVAEPIAMGDAGLYYQYYVGDIDTAQQCYLVAADSAITGAAISAALGPAGLASGVFTVVFSTTVLA
ncbi:MAG: hypothetical protein ABGW92_03715 [Methanocaldococcus sp.]